MEMKDDKVKIYIVSFKVKNEQKIRQMWYVQIQNIQKMLY